MDTEKILNTVMVKSFQIEEALRMAQARELEWTILKKYLRKVQLDIEAIIQKIEAQEDRNARAKN